MARNRQQQSTDKAKAKAQKQKRLVIVLCAVLGLVLVYEVPKMMKLMKSPAPAAAPATSPTETTTTPGAPASTPGLAPATPETNIVASVQATPDPGQLTEFTKFASKDPFNASVQHRSGAASGGTSGGSTPSGTGSSPGSGGAPKAPPAPPPTTAVISLNGELMAVSTGEAFPVSGATYDRVGSLFQLVSLTAKSAKVAIVGGSYADGSNALTLDIGKSVTLQNTADGTKYTLILEPQGTALPTSTTGTTTTPAPTILTTPATTTSSVVPASP